VTSIVALAEKPPSAAVIVTVPALAGAVKVAL
jgi:hypothetical protein